MVIQVKIDCHKLVEFSLASVSWYFGGNPIESSFALVSVVLLLALGG